MTEHSAITAPAAEETRIICQIDGELVHSIQSHIKKAHEGVWTLKRYEEEFPDAPLLSAFAKKIIDQRMAEKAEVAAKTLAEQNAMAPGSAASESSGEFVRSELTTSFATMHELFDLGAAPAALSSTGNPINVTVMAGHDDQALSYLPDTDRDYVFNIDLLKKVVVGFELGMPIYLWGFHGTGKTTILQQAAARSKRPFVRVQHTINMQESDVLGQWTVRNGSTIFQLGPLPMAMINGWIYCADEYDFAMPSVTSVYQPVLEGQSLLIKDAPPHFRKITPHENFRFCATGNTNGTGDETGLYQGTMIQNAANYSRFKITEEVVYMDAAIETNIVMAKTKMPAADAKKIVRFANDVRGMFRDGKIGMTISPRELISAGQLGIVFGGNWTMGLELAFANRLTRVDKRVVQEYLQRTFGK